jgi:hypothetical protein
LTNSEEKSELEAKVAESTFKRARFEEALESDDQFQPCCMSLGTGSICFATSWFDLDGRAHLARMSGAAGSHFCADRFEQMVCQE